MKTFREFVSEILSEGKAKTKVFKYKNEEWKVTLYPTKSVELEVDVNGIWTTVDLEIGEAENIKEAVDIAKKYIDSLS